MQETRVDSNLVSKGPCQQCGSSDNLALYDDGHVHCFTPGCTNHTNTTGSAGLGKKKGDLILDGETVALNKRGITEETCAKWGYKRGTFKDRPVQIAPYYDGNNLVAQKLRFPNKDFTFIGDPKLAGLFGQNLWRDGGKMVVVTEGEIDALTVSQLQGNKWPVVSVPNGAQGAKKSLAKALEWLNGFDAVVLMFDNDDAGNLAVEECTPLFPSGKCKVARLPLKDANEMLMAGRGKEVIDAIWGAKVHRPDGIVTLADIRGDVMKQPDEGLPWWCPTLTKLTYGRRTGEVYVFGAGTGIGKTDFLTQQVAYDVATLKEPVSMIYLEQQPSETGKRVAGKVAGKRFHVPDGSWTNTELTAALDKIDAAAPLFLYDHFGTCDWQNLRDRIRYLAHSENVRLFYLDHLTALAAEAEDERRALEEIMAQVGGLVKELNIVLHLVSHLATPAGKSHEEGGRVMIRHFKGSRSIGFWSHYMIGFERDQQCENEALRKITTVRVLKDRYTGQATGKVFYLGYDVDTGLLYETDLPKDTSSTGSPTGDDF